MAIVTGYEITRGRTTELDKVDAGIATIRMVDTNGSLDPSSGSDAFNPLKPVAIGLLNPVTGTSSTIFRGYVSRWDYDLYQTENYAEVTVECVDAFDLISATEMTPSPFGTQGAFGDIITSSQQGNIVYRENPDTNAVAVRINQVLDELGWPGGLREVFSGNVGLKETVYAPRSSAMTVIQDACDAEFPSVANFYIQKDGTATFHGRLARFHPNDSQYHISTWRCGDMAAVASDSSRALITALEFDRDKDKIINSALCTPEGIDDSDIFDQRVFDTGSISSYGIRSWSAENLILLNGPNGETPLEESLRFAQYYVDNYAQPATQVRRLSFSSRTASDTSSAQAARTWAILCGVDISDRVRITTTHTNGGGFSEDDFFVEGISYSVAPMQGTFLDVSLTLDVSPAAYYASAID